MTYLGHVENGVIVLDEANVLPEGAQVRVEPVTPAPQRTLNERFKNLIGRAPELPADMAENHDHYIHGTPKR